LGTRRISRLSYVHPEKDNGTTPKYHNRPNIERWNDLQSQALSNIIDILEVHVPSADPTESEADGSTIWTGLGTSTSQ